MEANLLPSKTIALWTSEYGKVISSADFRWISEGCLFVTNEMTQE
jgi:hypothetical protein